MSTAQQLFDAFVDWKKRKNKPDAYLQLFGDGSGGVANWDDVPLIVWTKPEDGVRALSPAWLIATGQGTFAEEVAPNWFFKYTGDRKKAARFTTPAAAYVALANRANSFQADGGSMSDTGDYVVVPE